MSASPVHPFARCARCEAPWHTGHALACPRREVEVEVFTVPDDVVALAARDLDDCLYDRERFEVHVGDDEPEWGVEFDLGTAIEPAFCDACHQQAEDFAPIAGAMLCRRCVPEGVTCDGCGSECFDFSQRDGGRLCICCVSNLRREDIATLDGISAVCERYGFEPEGEHDEATWLEHELAELQRRRAADTTSQEGA